MVGATFSTRRVDTLDVPGVGLVQPPLIINLAIRILSMGKLHHAMTGTMASPVAITIAGPAWSPLAYCR